MNPRLHAALFVVSLLATTGDAGAYCRKTTCDPSVEDCKTDEHDCAHEGVGLYWASLPIRYRFDAAGSKKLGRTDETRKAIRSAFARWSDVVCPQGRTSLRFKELEDTPVTSPDRTPFTIYFRDTSWPAEKSHQLARTTPKFGDTTGIIYSSIMEVNTFGNRFSTRDDVATAGTTSSAASLDESVDSAPAATDVVDLEGMVTHEVGHYIGLAHNSRDIDSVMTPNFCESEDRCSRASVEARRLSADDEFAVCMLYPPPEESASSATANAASCATAAVDARSDLSSGGRWLLAFLLIVPMARRIGRRRA